MIIAIEHVHGPTRTVTKIQNTNTGGGGAALTQVGLGLGPLNVGVAGVHIGGGRKGALLLAFHYKKGVRGLAHGTGLSGQRCRQTGTAGLRAKQRAHAGIGANNFLIPKVDKLGAWTNEWFVFHTISCWACWGATYRQIRAKEIGPKNWRCRTRVGCRWEVITVVISVHLQRNSNLLEIGNTRRLPGSFFCLGQSRKQHRRQNGNDGNDHQQFNEGETPALPVGSRTAWLNFPGP